MMESLLTTTILGSRHPFSIPVEKSVHHAELRVGPPSDTPTTVPHTVSKIRRKQLRTYRSPSASGVAELRLETVAVACAGGPASPRAIPSTSGDSTAVEDDPYAYLNKKHVYPSEPPLPLYHPKGQLALSLPELDPAIFGLASNAVNIDDHDIRIHVSLQDFDPRRSSSRARRPATKLRDGDEEDTNDVAGTVANAANGKKAADTSGQPRSTSPRKRRTAGAGAAGGGGKRRKKDADDADGTYPNPINRRTRNTRGAAAAVASPLAGPAVVADVEPDEGDGEGDGDDAATVAGEPAETAARLTRARRSCASAPKRRGSSASETTTTSVSVSIAANARTTRSGGAKRPSDDDLPVEADDQNLTQQAEDKADIADSAPSSPKETTEGIVVPTDKDAEEHIDHVQSPAIADEVNKSDESKDSQGDKETAQAPVGDGTRVQTDNDSNTQDVEMVPIVPSPPSSVRVSSNDDGGDKVAERPITESSDKMDVDTPESIVQPLVNQEEKRDEPTSDSSKPKSPSTHAPPPTSVPSPAKPPSHAPIPASVSVSVPARSQPAVIAPTKVPDDEKEEGELSDE